MRIDRLRIKNFKNFEKREFEFPEQFTVLIGDNGTGKTAVLDALAIAAGAYFLGIEDVPARGILKDEVRRSDYGENIEYMTPVEIEAEGFIKQDYHSKPLYHRWKRSLNHIGGKTSTHDAFEIVDTAKRQAAEVKNNEPVELPLIAYYGTGRLWAEEVGKITYQKKASRFKLGYENSLQPKVSSRGFLAWYKTFEDEALKFGRGRDLLKAFNEAVISVVPEWQKISFSFLEDDLMGLYTTPTGEKIWMPFQLLSDGFRNIVGLVADLAYRCLQLNPHLERKAIKNTAGIVLIDELDLHLHPKWQKSIVGDLKKTFPHIQFIATTHSPFIIQSLKRAELINLNKDTGEDPFRKSIEEIAETEMDVPNVERSERFEEMTETAEQYFALIKQGKTTKDSRQVRELKEKLDRLQERFSEDPAYTALLKAERKTEMNGE